jgi:lactate 2-monooxygenase
LEAHAFLPGRPYLWDLALGSEQEAREVVLNFLAEFDLTLALSGYSSLQSLDKSALVREA